MIDPSNVTGNLLRLDPSDRPLVTLSVEPRAGISIDGDGTVQAPLQISSTIPYPEPTFIHAGNSALQVQGDGSNLNPYTINHINNYGGVHEGFNFDEFGHLVGYTEPAARPGVQAVFSGDGIQVEQNPHTNAVTLSLTPAPEVVSDVFEFGGHTVELFHNRIQRVSRSIHFPAGMYKLGDYVLTINSFGTITAILHDPPPPDVTEDDPLLVTSMVSRRFPVIPGELRRQIRFTTKRDSSFRITYLSPGDLHPGMSVHINNMIIERGLSTEDRFEILTPTIYQAGTHTIAIDSQLSFGEEAWLDVSLTVVV